MKHPQQDILTKFTLLAKHVIYDPDRMRQFMHMLDTPPGAVMAVKTVMGAIEQAKPIPPGVLSQLATNVYLVLVDLAQEITKKKASPGLMQQVNGMIQDAVKESHGQPEQFAAQQPAARSQPQGGIIQQAQGAPA